MSNPFDDRDNTTVDKHRLERIDALVDGPIEENVVDAVNRVARELREQGTIPGEHIGNDHQESLYAHATAAFRGDGPNDEGTGFFRPVERFRAPEEMPRRPLIHPHVAEHGIPAFGTGLIWRASVQSPERPDLVNFDWAQQGGGFDPEVSNIELRTIYAHLLETAGRIRAEMRERQMQVDL